MGGLAVLLMVSLYLIAAVYVVRSANGQRAKIIAMIVAILIPTADVILGRFYLKYICETEGGAKVYRVVNNVDGFRWKGGIAMNESDEASKRFLNEFEVHFIESVPRRDGKVDRISLQGSEVTREIGVLPRSEYAIRFISSDFGPLSSYVKQQNIIERIVDKEIIATDTQFIFNGGWAEYLLASFSDAGPGGAAWCELPDSWQRLRKLVETSLKLR